MNVGKNEHSPYLVEFDKATGLYKFVSEYGVSFSVAFEENDLLLSGLSYQFALTNYEGKKSPRRRGAHAARFRIRLREGPL